jgi:nucleoside 2-deoxyribosyltransferase
MRIYLAGPEVFLADAADLAEAKKAICARHGAEGVFPTDNHADHPDLPGNPRWYSIYLRNEWHLRDCDALVANLTPFRGPSADPGTVYELGFARALGKPVAGYLNTSQRFTSRTLAFLKGRVRRRAEGVWEDEDGLSLEDFDLYDNLMIDGGITAASGVLMTREVAPDALWYDLGAFEDAVRALTMPRAVA